MYYCSEECHEMYSSQKCEEYSCQECDNRLPSMKVLPAPVMEIQSGPTKPKDGAWELGRILKPAALLRWGFIVIEPSLNARSDYSRIIISLRTQGEIMGMKMTDLILPQAHIPMKDLEAYLKECKNRGIQLVFIVLSQLVENCYHEVKVIGDLKVGILTQCIKEETAMRGMNTAVIRSILLKVNAKLLGVNHVLHSDSLPSYLKEPERVMLVGGHLFRPAPEQVSSHHSRVPSIAATSVSLDSDFTKYNVAICVQNAKNEEIVGLDDMMFNHLMLYAEYNNQALPTTIIYYRNIMKCTKYNETESYEFSKFLTAYARVSQSLRPSAPATTPKILFVVVESPRNCRFRPMYWERRWDNLKNARPGTLIKHFVDTFESHRQVNFSMVSYQGTAKRRLTNYYVYYNNAVPTADIERLTYYLCYLNARGPQSIACPVPLHYARLASRRGLSFTFGARYNSSFLDKGPLPLFVNKSLREEDLVMYFL